VLAFAFRAEHPSVEHARRTDAAVSSGIASAGVDDIITHEYPFRPALL
jgi:hypothetical protein